MTVIGNPRSFHKRFKFIVEIDDIGTTAKTMEGVATL